MPWVQTLHDVIPLVDDSPGFDLERRRWRRYAPRFREASAVIAISRYCADQGIALLGLDPRVVHVVYHGVSERFRTGPPEPREDPYVLYVGEFDPRKGYKEAFAVAGELAEAGLPHRLKVAGRIAPWRRAEIEQLAAAAPRPDRIDLLGYVDHDNELPALYRGASAMLITSRHEGFGLPAAEAMAMGLPVVAFRNTATTEIVADGGILVDDGDVAGFAGRVQDLLTDDRRWAAASAAGIDRASVFEWQKCADEHAAIYAAIQS
jgi:alpha-1,3-rhamnosyl/mannosyltransferase